MAFRLAALSAVVLAFLLAAGCDETWRLDDDEVLSGDVLYKTRGVETPYTIAKKAYGDRWQGYRIAEANKGKLEEEGYFKDGTEVRIPPDVKTGRAVDPRVLGEDSIVDMIAVPKDGEGD